MAEQLGARVRTAVEGLTPGYFPLVMATGIISVDMHLEGFDLLSDLLMVVCAATFVVLVSPTALHSDFEPG